jgi:hypothetical protein
MVSDVNETSRGFAIGLKLGIKFRVGGKKLTVHRKLVKATVQSGSLVGKRLDCLGR